MENILRGTTYDGACAPTHIHLTERIKDVKKGMKSYTVYAEVHMMIMNNNIIFFEIKVNSGYVAVNFLFQLIFVFPLF